MNMIVSIIGQRKIKNCASLKTKLREKLIMLIENGATKFLINDYGDFNALALDILYELKLKFFNFVVYINLPYIHQTNIDKSYEIILRENKYIIDKCNLVLCFVDTKVLTGIAKSSLEYAIKRNKIVTNLYK